MQYKVDKLDVNIYPSNREMGQAAAKAIGDRLVTHQRVPHG